MAGPYQVIKFVELDFDAGWDRVMLVTGYANIRYTATAKRGGELAVVFEGATGVMETYHFRVGVGQEVYVVDQVVHIPARCYRKEGGNTNKCGR